MVFFTEPGVLVYQYTEYYSYVLTVEYQLNTWHKAFGKVDRVEEPKRAVNSFQIGVNHMQRK